MMGTLNHRCLLLRGLIGVSVHRTVQTARSGKDTAGSAHGDVHPPSQPPYLQTGPARD